MAARIEKLESDMAKQNESSKTAELEKVSLLQEIESANEKIKKFAGTRTPAATRNGSSVREIFEDKGFSLKFSDGKPIPDLFLSRRFSESFDLIQVWFGVQ